MTGEELVDHFREQLMRNQRWVRVIANDNAADPFGASVGVECVVYEKRGGKLVIRS